MYSTRQASFKALKHYSCPPLFHCKQEACLGLEGCNNRLSRFGDGSGLEKEGEDRLGLSPRTIWKKKNKKPSLDGLVDGGSAKEKTE